MPECRGKRGGSARAGNAPGRESQPAAGEPADAPAAEALQLIERASDLVAERKHWTKGALARDKHSRPVWPSSDRAVRFCVGGALLRAADVTPDGAFCWMGREQPDGESLVSTALSRATIVVARAAALLLTGATEITVVEGKDGEPRLRYFRKEDAVKEFEETISWPGLVLSFNDAGFVNHRLVTQWLRVSRVRAAAVGHLPGKPSEEPS